MTDLRTPRVPYSSVLEAWRAAIIRAYGPLEISLTCDDNSSGHVRFSRRGSLQFIDVGYTGQVVERTPANLSHAKDEIFVLARPTLSPLHWETRRGQCLLERGSAYLVHHAIPVKFEAGASYRGLSLCLPAAALRSRDPKIDSRYSTRLDMSSVRTQLLYSYINHVQAGLDTWSDDEFTNLCERLFDLIVLLMGHEEQSRPATQDSTVKAAHRERAIAYIKSQLNDSELNIEKIARNCDISASYLRQVFSLGGLTVENYIYSQRIEKCREFLVDPCQRNKSISQIAYQAGFRNVSHFSRLFKDRFGVSPKDYRGANTLCEPAPRIPDGSRAGAKKYSFEFELPSRAAAFASAR